MHHLHDRAMATSIQWQTTRSKCRLIRLKEIIYRMSCHVNPHLAILVLCLTHAFVKSADGTQTEGLLNPFEKVCGPFIADIPLCRKAALPMRRSEFGAQSNEVSYAFYKPSRTSAFSVVLEAVYHLMLQYPKDFILSSRFGC